MAIIPLSRGMYALVDAADVPVLSQSSWTAKPSRQKHARFYAHGQIGGKKFYMHRLLLGAKPGQIVDHINGDSLDNRRSNLRIADHRLNALNRGPSTNKYGLRGVCSKNTGFCAIAHRGRVKVRSKQVNNPIKAAFDYDQIAFEIHGSDARLNFPCVRRGDAK